MPSAQDPVTEGMRVAVVLDTNVLVAAGFNAGSCAARIVNAVREERLEMIWCDETKRESERILRKIPPLDWSRFEGLFVEASRRHPKLETAAYAYIADPADRVFAALARAAGATLITQDDHLLALRSKADSPILTAREFVRFVWRDDAATATTEDGVRPTPEHPQDKEDG